MLAGERFSATVKDEPATRTSMSSLFIPAASPNRLVDIVIVCIKNVSSSFSVFEILGWGFRPCCGSLSCALSKVW